MGNKYRGSAELAVAEAIWAAWQIADETGRWDRAIAKLQGMWDLGNIMGLQGVCEAAGTLEMVAHARNLMAADERVQELQKAQTKEVAGGLSGYPRLPAPTGRLGG